MGLVIVFGDGEGKLKYVCSEFQRISTTFVVMWALDLDWYYYPEELLQQEWGDIVDKIFCFLGKSSNQRYNLSNLGTESYADGKRIHQWSDRLRHTAKEVPNRMLITLRQEMTVLSSFQTGCFNDISALALIRKLFWNMNGGCQFSFLQVHEFVVMLMLELMDLKKDITTWNREVLDK